MNRACWIIIAVMSTACNSTQYPDYKQVAPGLYMQLKQFDSEVSTADSCFVYELHIQTNDSLLNTELVPEARDNMPNWFRHHEPELKLLQKYLQHLQPGDSAVFIDHDPSLAVVSDSVVISVWWKSCFDRETFERVYSQWLNHRELHERDRVRRYSLANGFTSSVVHPAVVYRVEESGEGEPLKYGDRITIHYSGHYLNGQVFDDTRRHDAPLSFELGSEGQVLTGMEYGLIGVRSGERRSIVIPSPFAFGEKGSSTGIIPPFTPLLYKVWVLPSEKNR